MNKTTMEKGVKSSKNKKYSINYIDPYIFTFLLSAVIIVVTLVSIVGMWIKNGRIDDLLLLSSSVLILYFSVVMVFSRFRIERKREERIENYLNEFKSQIMNQFKNKTIEDLNNKAFEGVVLEQERQAFSQYLSEISGDAELYYELAKKQYDRAVSIYQKKKYNEALKVLDLSKNLYKIAYSIEKPKTKNEGELKELLGLNKEIETVLLEEKSIPNQ